MKQNRLNNLLKEHSTADEFHRAAKWYKRLMWARLDLRHVDELIQIHKEIENNSTGNIQRVIPALYFSSVVKYGSWFKPMTNKKTKFLDANEIFNGHRILLELHKGFVTQRDEVFAHPERNLGGEQEFNLVYDRNGKVIDVCAPFNLILATRPDELQKCVWHVHNYIDAILIPRYQRELFEQIDKLPREVS